jgi:hypothetical protein
MAKLSAFTGRTGLGSALETEVTGALKGQEAASQVAMQEIAGREFEVSPHRKKLAQEAGFGDTLKDIERSIKNFDTKRFQIKKEIDELKRGKPVMAEVSSLDKPIATGETMTSLGAKYGFSSTEIANAIAKNPALEKVGKVLTPAQKALFETKITKAEAKPVDTKAAIAEKRKLLAKLFVEAAKARRRFNKEIPGLSQLKELVGVEAQKAKIAAKGDADDALKIWKEFNRAVTRYKEESVDKWRLAADKLLNFVGGSLMRAVDTDVLRNPNKFRRIAESTKSLINGIGAIITGTTDISSLVPDIQRAQDATDSTAKKLDPQLRLILNYPELVKRKPEEQRAIKKRQAGIYVTVLKNLYTRMGTLPDLSTSEANEFNDRMMRLAIILTRGSGRLRSAKPGIFGSKDVIRKAK